MSLDTIIERLCSLMHGVFNIILKLQTRNPDLLIYDVKYRAGNGKEEGFSQYGQDLFCFYNVFGSAREGVFVDVGANHPKLLNNTYYFEKNGWHGIAFEPQERLRKLWEAERTTKCLPYVLGGENKRVSFVETPGRDNHVLAGVEGFNKIDRSMPAAAALLTQRRLDEVLLENQIRRVDYLSIDVEGYEMNVLSGLDLSKIDIKCIDIENDAGEPYLGNSGLRRHLLNSGYRQIARLMGDDIFVKEQSAPGAA